MTADQTAIAILAIIFLALASIGLALTVCFIFSKRAKKHSPTNNNNTALDTLAMVYTQPTSIDTTSVAASVATDCSTHVDCGGFDGGGFCH